MSHQPKGMSGTIWLLTSFCHFRGHHVAFEMEHRWRWFIRLDADLFRPIYNRKSKIGYRQSKIGYRVL